MERFRILVAAQETDLRSTLRLGLQLAGHLVAEAPDGFRALEILQTEPPDLVLLDLRIPRVGSVAFLAEAHCPRRPPRLRTVVLAEADDIEAAIEALMLGASDFLEKPLCVEAVRSCIESVMLDAAEDGWNPEPERGDVLEAILVALQRGKFGSVEPALLGSRPLTEAACLNLGGVVNEAHGRTDAASKYYRRALSNDPRYWPAGENLQRLCELRECGETNRPVFFREMGQHPGVADPLLNG